MNNVVRSKVIVTVLAAGILATECSLWCRTSEAAALQDTDLSFSLSFDKKTTVADLARGNPASTTFNDSLEFRTILGVNGRNAFNIKEGESLKYDVTNNLDHRQGALTIWLMANNYDPDDVRSPDGKLCHKSFVNVLFKNGNDWVSFFMYEYLDTPTFYFYWHSSWCRPNMYKTAGAPATKYRRKQWFQLAITWNLETIRLYLDGELRSEVRLPEEAKLARDLKPSPAESFLGIRDRLWPDTAADVGKETVVDDIHIYSRPLSALEIKRQYQQSAPERGGSEEVLPNIDILLSGVDDGIGPLNRLRVDLDYHPLTEGWQKAIAGGNVKAKGVVKTPSGNSIVQDWQPASLQESRVVSGVDKEGEFVYSLTLTESEGKTEKAAKKIVRPNTDWFDNNLGLDDEVPSPWTPMTVSNQNAVKVWGRTYEFGNHPLPRKIIHTGDSILTQPPELEVETEQGISRIRYEITKREIHKSYVDFTGTGAAKAFTLSWKTRVEFDGFIRWDFTVHGEPKVRSMKLTWTVNRKFAEYVLDPLLLQTGNGTAKMPFTTDGQRSTILWLTSDKKGLCWAPEHDANWVYDRANGKPIQAEVTDRGGRCTVAMIQKPVMIPEGASYHAMFIATPSRPLPKVCRTYRFGGFGRTSNSDVSLEHQGGAGTDSVFTLRPAADFGEGVEGMRRGGVKRVAMYGAATALNDACLEGKYFGKYWDIPGGPSYPFETRGEKYMQTNTCPSTRYSDYILWNLRLLFTHPQQMHCAVYYDLAGTYLCPNPLHGCSFKDAFGNAVNRLIVMGLRRHLMRTMKYCHQRGRDTILHAHSFYNPICHAFGDYWFPGEQYTGPIQQKGPYFYSDDLPDSIYRSELNMHLKGSAILFNGSLKRGNEKYGTEEQTLAMCTKLLLNDVAAISIAYEDPKVINRIWGILLKYQLDDAKVVFYYDKDNRVKSSNPNVVATCYQCRDGRVLTVVGNLSKEDQTAEIDFSEVKKKLVKVRDEYVEQDLDAPNGKVSLPIKARQFRIIGF